MGFSMDRGCDWVVWSTWAGVRAEWLRMFAFDVGTARASWVAGLEGADLRTFAVWVTQTQGVESLSLLADRWRQGAFVGSFDSPEAWADEQADVCEARAAMGDLSGYFDLTAYARDRGLSGDVTFVAIGVDECLVFDGRV